LPRFRFRILTLLVITAVVAVLVCLLMPFEPSMSFSTPSWSRRVDYETQEEYDIVTITVTNTSSAPFWLRGNDAGTITTYGIRRDPPVGDVTWHGSNSTPFTWDVLYRGDSATIQFQPWDGWEAGIVELEVSDWRGRKVWRESRAIPLEKPPAINPPEKNAG